ncbi:DUF3658 domain-containing protein [Lichenihabitans psoromatis]|uniref:DUF3658 domain-containing protein n=1 Tax=Lichenihabitans psoromatis TaxID=2528642 RepID=UPI001038478A|nr:DUF3658 domain-containing protein [Lichenihabitans psoromatis]
MNRTLETVHVVFGWSIAETLREALGLLGVAERVIGLPDCLSVGPIDPADPMIRRAWGASVLKADALSQDEPDCGPIDVEMAWAEATAPSIHPVFWVCLSSPMEHACFLAFAARMNGRRFDIVDATNLEVATRDGVRRPWSLGSMRAQDIVASKLYEKRRPLADEDCRAAAMAWSELRRENAPFRIVTDDRLVSAPLTHYDALLVEQAGQDWEIAARLIGRTIGKLSFGDAATGQDTCDVVLFGRMLALGHTGSLEVAGHGPGLRDYQVRRPVP